MVHYFNTGSPIFGGLEFTNAEEILSLLQTSLLQANWIVTSDEIINNSTLLMEGATSNGDKCYIKFSVSNNYLQIQGDLEGDGLYLSPALELEFTPDDVNRFWLTCDRDSGAICIRSKLLYSGAITFGFLERFDENDADAWMIAKLNNRLNDAYVAKAKHDGVIWKQIGADFASADNFSSTTLNGGYQGILDFMTVPNPYVSFFNTNLRNVAYSAHLGQVEQQSGRPVVTRRFYIEGRGSTTNYSGDNPPVLYNRGFIKHVANGFGKIPQGKTELSNDGSRYLSVGSEGWQGLKLESNPVTQTELPTIFRSESGEIFSLADNLKSEIRNTLLNAQWEIAAENATRILFKGRYNQENYCYLRVETNLNTLMIQGDISGDETDLSPVLTLPFIDQGFNRLWLSANRAALALCIKTAEGSYKGIWFGYLRSDTPRWGLGYIKSDLDSSYLLKNNEWRTSSYGFSFAMNSLSSFPITTFDRLTTASTPVQYYDSTDNRNSAYKAYNGQVNGVTSQPQLDFYALVEGNNSAIAYGLSAEGEGNAPKLTYLGTVEFLATGLASLSGGEIVTTSTGAKYMSTGNEGWQGMRIK